ncbi:tetratricopeptide repeat protein [Sphingomonas glaciei]|uniref:Tetratricopeptide repeat protein n=1 Tax=Sphingomonas glaciei TaxID=2938948 RepID=A0ABY5MVR4_9SPHN|nr:tetratricopeptide repeat protein [Sphingomonas glaciei]UUR08540.1 tetratricopeptide repeat protein [Sphingomonas glaciei]
MGPITLTCSLALALAAAAPGQARVDFLRSGASTFVAARAAATAGDARRAAMLYASLAAADPNDRLAARRAVGQAILAGDMPQALRLAQRQPRDELAVDARLLMLGEALRKGRVDKDIGTEFPQQFEFMAPFLGAWRLSERGRWQDALKLLDSVGASSPLGQFVPEHKALILLAAGRSAEARPLIAPALAAAKGRANRLRIAFATGLVARGERDAGLALLAGRDVTLRTAAARVGAERRPRLPIATAAEGLSELVVALAVSLDAEDSGSLPLGLAQVARHADPRNEQATLLTGLLLDRSGRGDDGIAVLRSLPDNSLFLAEARDAEVRILLGGNRQQEALARARAFVAGGDAQAADWLRLGDVLEAMKRYDEAAVAYGGAAAAVQAGGAGPEPWSIHLLRGAALEQGGKWPQAESALELAHKLAPDNPAVLNYLGYARLERGEQLDEAEALIAEASRRAPDDASITDSLGWAQFKRGKVAAAILTLQRAAAADPAQSEIHEHLGDALYTAGRKYEARFAWQAALVTAEDDVRKRVQDKIGAGLNAATAAP